MLTDRIYILKHWLNVALARPQNHEPTLQEFFFRRALEEVGVHGGPIRINHFEGTCWHPHTGTRPITFPQYLLALTNENGHTKSQDYFFKGVISDKRQWLRDYPNVSSDSRGRDPSKKYDPDYDYYNKLSKSRYCLAPTGDCPWSYRFFEGIMCFAIPVLADDEDDIFCGRFYFFRDSQSKHYDESHAKQNYEKMKKYHTLIDLIKK